MQLTVGQLDDVFIMVEGELRRAIKKHGINQTPLNPDMSDQEKAIIVVEEVGEIARALTYDGVNKQELKDEILQAATMLIAWRISLETSPHVSPVSGVPFSHWRVVRVVSITNRHRLPTFTDLKEL